MVDTHLVTIRSLCQAAGLPALDVTKHFIPVTLPVGHDKAFGSKFRWIL